MLFVSSLSSRFNDSNSSYVHRITVFKEALDKRGISTKFISVGDNVFGKPAIISPMAIPFYLNDMRKFDIIHAGGNGSAYFVSIAKPFLSPNTKIIYDVHGDPIEEARLVSLYSSDIFGFAFWHSTIMELIGRKKSDYFIACSNVLHNQLLRYGIEKSKIITIYNGVDIHNFFPIPRSPKSGLPFTVTYAGRFQKWQGIDLLLEAAQLLKDVPILFRFIGFHKDEVMLKREIKAKLGNRAELIDAVPRSFLNQYLSKTDLLIIPRIRHHALEVAFPTKFAEYLATGLPIITTDVGEIAQLVRQHHCGFVCPPFPHDLADAIVSAMQMDPKTLSILGHNARTLAETRFNLETIQNLYYNFIKNIS
ncbi:MAG: glycosyltransferase family 4 protein [Candidatus Methanosuratincola petrocarbonis]